MALDVYVGPLSRYYTGRWKTVLHQWAETSRDRGEEHEFENGHRCRVQTIEVVPSTEPGPVLRIEYVSSEGEVFEAVEVKTKRRLIPPTTSAADRVHAWVSALNQGLGDRLSAAVGWHDDENGPYFTDKPGWLPFLALQLWAAYEEHPDLRLPPGLPDKIKDDPAYHRSTVLDFKGRYTHLLGLEMWLPGSERIVFTTENPAGTKVRIGFVGCLLEELEALNERTWRADGEVIEAWERNAHSAESSLEQNAKFGFAVLLGLARKATAHRLPMVLDF